jgi:hypothetical protein
MRSKKKIYQGGIKRTRTRTRTRNSLIPSSRPKSKPRSRMLPTKKQNIKSVRLLSDGRYVDYVPDHMMKKESKLQKTKNNVKKIASKIYKKLYTIKNKKKIKAEKIKAETASAFNQKNNYFLNMTDDIFNIMILNLDIKSLINLYESSKLYPNKRIIINKRLAILKEEQEKEKEEIEKEKEKNTIRYVYV